MAQHASRPRRTRSPLRIIAILIGAVMLLFGASVAAGGGLMLAGQGIATDDDGYFEAPTERIESDGVAVISDEIDLDIESNDEEWFFNWLDVDVRLRVNGAGASNDVFVGIARTSDVAEYLSGASHSVLTDFDRGIPTYDNVDGSTSVDAPADQTFWVEQSSGSGEQEVRWEPRSGRWSVIVMNSDGSAGVDVDVDAGARSGAITPIGVTVLIFGSITTLAAIGLLVFGARRPRSPGSPGDDAAQPFTPAPTAPTAPVSPMPAPPTPVAPAWPVTPTGADSAHVLDDEGVDSEVADDGADEDEVADETDGEREDALLSSR